MNVTLDSWRPDVCWLVKDGEKGRVHDKAEDMPAATPFESAPPHSLGSTSMPSRRAKSEASKDSRHYRKEQEGGVVGCACYRIAVQEHRCRGHSS